MLGRTEFRDRDAEPTFRAISGVLLAIARYGRGIGEAQIAWIADAGLVFGRQLQGRGLTRKCADTQQACQYQAGRVDYHDNGSYRLGMSTLPIRKSS